MQHTIEICRTSEEMPEVGVFAITQFGQLKWTGDCWTRQDGSVAYAPAWWCYMPDSGEVLSKLDEPVNPVEDPPRIRTHAELYRTAVGLCELLGVKGRITSECVIDDAGGKPDVSLYLSFLASDRSCRLSTDRINSDPQLVYNEFERLMRGCFEPLEAIPATIEACDGTSILEKA